MNRDGISFTSPSASPKAGTLIPKKGAQAADPTVQGTGMRTNIPAGKDRNGAAYSIKSNYMRQTSP
jgi:hypothetical protein